MPQVIVDIDPTGNSTIEAQGVTGSSCQDLTRNIERALGKTTGDVKKPEFHQTTQTNREAKQS
jgi:hypothetical protein